MAEIIDQSDNVMTTCVRLGRGDDALQELDFVQCGFGIMSIRLDDF